MNDNLSPHPLQSIEWGEFRKKTEVKVIRVSGIQITIHAIPHTPWTIGYVPKGPLPNKETIRELIEIGGEKKCIFIQLEPQVIATGLPANALHRQLQAGKLKIKIENLGLKPAAHPLFTRYTFILDLNKSEEDLLKAMKPKTRYNIRIALKHGVRIVQDDSGEAFETYLRLTEETTKRQRFYAHTQRYHRLMWETLKNQKSKIKNQNLDTDKLTAHLFLAKYREQTLVAWIIFVYKDTLYYPYGASSSLHKETMASNLMMWEVIKFGKKLGLKKFDMWGALDNNPNKNDPWYGFHRFKEGYGPKHIEFAGSFDLVINSVLYKIYKILNKIRWTFLRIKK